LPSYAELRLSPNSWTTLCSAQAATYVTRAYRADDESDDAAIANAATASGLALTDVAIATVAPAIRDEAWTGNCVAIGSSAGTFDPLLDLDLHVAQLGIVHLLSLFPTTIAPEAERAEYNRVIRSLFERLRDFQVALYLLAGASPVGPPSLNQKVDTFRARGTIAPMEDETFTPDQWSALFAGLGLMPETWPPAIETVPPERMKEGFRRILGFVSSKVLDQPTHDRYLADIGADATS
jgi:tryptophan halogenase